MGKTNQPKVKVLKLERDLVKAIKIINKFFEINNLKIKYTLVLDYQLRDAYGIYWPEEKNTITINPSQFQNTEKEDLHCPNFTNDLGICAVTVHEICHLLDERFKITEKYKERFSGKFILNANSKKDWYENTVELLRTYILNPYLLKIVAPEQFEFLKSLYKSPNPCTKQNFLSKYTKFPKEIKEICLKKWKIKVSGTEVVLLK